MVPLRIVRSLFLIAAAMHSFADAWAAPAFDALVGKWVRRDGGYVIAVKSVGADGKLDAAYANPRPLPFSIAQAKHEGSTLKVMLELRAAGYGGSTYTLTYDRKSDSLKGVYYQAVAREKYNVQFDRVK